MNIIEYLLIAAGVIVILLGLATLVSRVSEYYSRRYNISIWGGVLLLALAAVCAGLGYFGSILPPIPLYISSGFIVLFAGFLDIHHAGIGMGFVAFILQGLLALGFVFVLLILLFYFVVHTLFPQRTLPLTRFFGLRAQRRPFYSIITSGCSHEINVSYRFIYFGSFTTDMLDVCNDLVYCKTKKHEIELQIYRILGIPKFRDFIFRIEKIRHQKDGERNHNYHLKNISMQSVQKFEGYLIYNSFIHIISLFISIVCLVLTRVFYSSCYAVYGLLVFLGLFNVWCILLQRYNFLRIVTLLQKADVFHQRRINDLAAKIIQDFPEHYCEEYMRCDWQMVQMMLNAIKRNNNLVLSAIDAVKLDRMSSLINTAERLQKPPIIRKPYACEAFLEKSISDLLDARVICDYPYNKVDLQVDRLMRFMGKGPLISIASITTEDIQTEKAYRKLFKSSSPERAVEILETLELVFSKRLAES